MRLSVLFVLSLAAGSSLAARFGGEHLKLKSEFGVLPEAHSARGLPAPGKKGVMFMNRIGPSSSTLYIADTDGGNPRKLLNDSQFEYHASFSPDGKWITFTSERGGDGNSDVYRIRPDGSGMQKVVATSSFEDALVLSPNGTKAAYVSTANGYRSNIWVKDLITGAQYNLTNTTTTTGNQSSPDGHFRPAWSPDGQWIASSSDRNTKWRGHGNGTGWEHTQELSIYAIRPDGTGFRQIATKSGYCLGSPKWSLDGKRIIYYEITTEDTWDAHRPEDIDSTTSQIVSVDFATGTDRIEHTSGSGVKMFPQWVTEDVIGFLIKGDSGGINYTTFGSGYEAFAGQMRAPAWSPDGKSVIYEVPDWTVRPMEKTLYSWDEDWEYRFTDVFPQLSLQGRLAMTQKQLGNSSIVSMNPDGTDLKLVFDVYATDQVNASLVNQGLAGAFQPTWTTDGEWIAFGLGSWFQERGTYSAWIIRAKSDGSYYEELTNGTINSGFPSYSPDGKYLVYRVWGDEFGLRIMDLTTKSVRVLTTERDNLPFFSPDGDKIVFTRNMSASTAGDHYDSTNYDVLTIRPNGTDIQVLTSSSANDAHAVWTADGRIMWSSGMYGFRDECAIYDQTFQPYGQIMIMDADGSNKRMLTDSMWEDSMPLYVPNEFLE